MPNRQFPAQYIGSLVFMKINILAKTAVLNVTPVENF